MRGRCEKADVLRKHLLILEGKEVVARTLRRQQFKGLPCRFHGLSGEGRLEDRTADTAGIRGRKEAGETCGVPAITAKGKRDDRTQKEMQRKL